MATYPKIVKDRIEALRRDFEDNKARYIAAIPAFAAAARATGIAQIELDTDAVRDIKVREWLDGASVCIRCEVKNFRDVAPLLDFIEAQGYEFRTTNDYPVGSEREFKSVPADTPVKPYYWQEVGITVAAHLMGEGEDGCRRVITRWETPAPRPVYGFDCGDPAAIPRSAEEDVPQ